MCSKLLVSLWCAISVAVSSGSPCDDGWTFFPSGNKCIRVTTSESKSWYDAKRSCMNEGGRLLTIPDHETQMFINKLIGPNAPYLWIGLHDINSESYFEWEDGTNTCGYVHWPQNEPNNLEEEDCVQLLQGGDHFWNDKDCGYGFPYICEKRGPGCEVLNGGCPYTCTDGNDKSWVVQCSCDEGFAEHDGKCYDLNECSVNNGGCDSYCENKVGSFECTCNIDYVYNGTHCVVEDDILIGRRK